MVFRDEQGKPAVLSDTCIHRGASLSAGKCKEDGTVQCPYHGWRFNSQGVCTRIPSIGKTTKPPPRARVDSYPVEEKYGIVFAFLGDLPADLKARIKTAFRQIQDMPWGAHSKVKRWEFIDDSVYDVVRDTAKVLKLDLSKIGRAHV